MAIIKCPECGRQISDKAPTCPNCGVEIAGKTTRCPQCGEVYFSSQEACPNCHHLTYTPRPAATPTPTPAEGAQPATPVGMPPMPPTPPHRPETGDKGDAPKKSRVWPFIVAAIMAVALCGACFYFYDNAKKTKENEAYEFAIKSDDPFVLQTYLDNNADAPDAHRDAILSRLEQLKQQDREWANAAASGSKAALEDYIAKHADSEHLDEARHKIDSIDWADANNENTIESMQRYLSEHANGEHVDEANTALKAIKAKTVQAEDRTLVSSALRRFFQSVNSRNEGQLESSVTPLLTNFLGKTDATKADVVTFMHKIYKDDITNMNWRLNGDYKIDKKEIGDEQYEYTASVSAVQSIERTDESKETEVRYQIKATINPEGLVSALSMTKLME